MITENARLHQKMTKWTMTIVQRGQCGHHVEHDLLLKIPPDVICLDKKHRDAIC